MDLIPGALRGMGHSFVPMILSVIGTVGTRIIWIYGFFPQHRSLFFLFISYPGSWIATILMQAVCLWVVRKKCRAVLKSREKQGYPASAERLHRMCRRDLTDRELVYIISS